MANQKVKDAAKAADVRLWEVAEAIGISDGAFSRKLRRELPEAEQRKILSIVADLARRKEAEAHEDAGN